MRRGRIALRRVIEVRSRTGIWAYLVCIFVLLGFALLAAEEDVRGTLPYFVVVAICVVQMIRPTLLVWFVLTAAFWAYAVGVIVIFRSLISRDFLVFLFAGLIPAVCLLWARPKQVAHR